MRTIRFRAWKQSEKKMLSWYELRDTGKALDCLNGIIYHAMQFTGLLDKNGKEIYEGDIVKHNKEFGEIQWFRSMWSLHVKFKGGGSSNSHGILGDVLEIIGNIHESPELLK